MLTRYLLTFLCTGAIAISSPASENRVAADRTMELVLAVDGDVKSFETSTTNGNITITGTDSSQILVHALITVTGSSLQRCTECADDVKITLETEDDNAVLTPDMPNRIGVNYQISYDIRLPRHLDISAHSLNGQIRIDKVSGDMELNTANGAITVGRSTGNIDAATLNGAIRLTDIESHKVSGSTLNGAIDIRAPKRAPEKLELNTKNGAINVTSAADVNAHLEISNVVGGIELDLGGGRVISKSRGDIELDVGTGKGSYQFESINGQVTLTVLSEE